jgi:3-hydroxyacyl-CoA dehydrogenase/enoyl-CoA hydratase/3-hydroxybutyryl-CoA epimerase
LPVLEPERLVGLHFNPVAQMQLVEVVRGRTTDDESFAKAAAFVGAIRRLPLPVTSSPGFLVNRILMPYLMEAVIMVMEGIPAAAVDRAALEFGMPMGPIELADTVGLDICLSAANPPGITARGAEAVGGAGAPAGSEKSGQGFTRSRRGGGTVEAKWRRRQPVWRSLMLRLFNEAVACRREGVVADEDLLDAGVIFGTGFAPFRGGPLRHVRSEGVAALYRKLQGLEARYGGRFAPDAGWRDLLEKETVQ